MSQFFEICTITFSKALYIIGGTLWYDSLRKSLVRAFLLYVFTENFLVHVRGIMKNFSAQGTIIFVPNDVVFAFLDCNPDPQSNG